MAARKELAYKWKNPNPPVAEDWSCCKDYKISLLWSNWLLQEARMYISNIVMADLDKCLFSIPYGHILIKV